MKYVLTGGSGFTGTAIVQQLVSENDKAVIVTRTPGNFKTSTKCSYAATPKDKSGWQHILADADIVINLTGDNLAAGRWNAQKKEMLVKSRVETTTALAQALATVETNCRLFISSSAIGYYGSQPHEGIDETHPAGTGFLAELCTNWEQATAPLRGCSLRVVHARTGIVLGNGGALEKMLLPFKLGLGCPLGSGQQWMSWIHIADFCQAIQFIINNESMTGPVNFTAPNPVTNHQFSKILARKLRRPSLPAAPAFALRLILGEKASILLTGQHVIPGQLLQSGFSFRYETLEAALDDLLASR